MSKWVNHSKVAGQEWSILETDDGKYAHEQVEKALLMDIRDELRKLNRIIGCHNFIAVPDILRGIKRNTAKRKKPRAVGKPKLRVVSR